MKLQILLMKMTTETLSPKLQGQERFESKNNT